MRFIDNAVEGGLMIFAAPCAFENKKESNSDHQQNKHILTTVEA